MAAQREPRAKSPPPLTVDRLLQINLAVLVPLGAMLLGMGERDFLLAGVLLIVAVASIVFVDRWGWIEVGRLPVNLAALAVTLYSMVRFLTAPAEEQLILIADLLVYLQLVLLVQKKNYRVGWQLLALSVLEVVVATALNLSIMFGVLMVVYVFVALATLGLLFIQTEAERIRGYVRSGGARGTMREPASESGAGQAGQASSRWPLRREIQVTVVTPPDLARQMLGRGIMGRTAMMGLGTMVVAAVCFFLMPRFGKALLDPMAQQATVGYSPGVKLGDLGPLLENPEIVMQVEVRDESTGGLPTMREPPLLRGGIVTTYNRGQWRHPEPHGPRTTELPFAPDGASLILQRVVMQPQAESVAFGIFPPYRAEGSEGRKVRFDHALQQLSRTGRESRETQYTYDLLTVPMPDGRPCRVFDVARLPQPREIGSSRGSSEADRWLATQRMLSLQLPDESSAFKLWRNGGESLRPDLEETNPETKERDRIAGVRAAAAKRIKDARVDPDNYYAVAKSLETMLSEPPFEYTLDRPAALAGVDPIEDFVTRNRRGHCEYFASALTLMLRSRGIPARMIVGFRGGDWNPGSGVYTVRQLNAHAWVEALLDSDHVGDIPANERPPSFDGSKGAWLVLDPTPRLDFAENTYLGSWRSRVAGITNYMQIMWNTYVVGLNAERQEKSIFQPLSEVGQTLKAALLSPLETIGHLATHLWQWLFGKGDGTRPAFDWQIALSLVLLAAVSYIAMRLTRRTWRWLRTKFGRGRHKAALARTSPIDFYRRLESLLARHGMRRGRGQTQLEFARLAGRRLERQWGDGIRDLPRRLVDSFYLVRFGGRALDSSELQAVEQVLDQLSQTLRQRPGGSKTP